MMFPVMTVFIIIAVAMVLMIITMLYTPGKGK
jgi:hypothetical protein